MVPFWVGAPPILVYVSGDWDVRRGYGILTSRSLVFRLPVLQVQDSLRANCFVLTSRIIGTAMYMCSVAACVLRLPFQREAGRNPGVSRTERADFSLIGLRRMRLPAACG